MNFKIKSLVLLAGLALSSTSPLMAGVENLDEVYNEENKSHYQIFKELEKLHYNPEVLEGNVKGTDLIKSIVKN